MRTAGGKVFLEFALDPAPLDHTEIDISVVITRTTIRIRFAMILLLNVGTLVALYGFDALKTEPNIPRRVSVCWYAI
jgi:hypothetical protein